MMLRRMPAGLLLLMAIVLMLVTGYSVAAMAAPRPGPRLAFLPRPTPAVRTWSDGCNEHTNEWRRSGLFWGFTTRSTATSCHPLI